MNRKTLLLTFSFLILTFFLFILSLSVGSSGYTLTDLLANEDARAVVVLLRLPRALGCMACGLCLSVAGLLLQNATSNELASPNIIGVNSGAGFFVLLMLLHRTTSSYLVSLAAFIGALLSSALVLLISQRARSSTRRAPLILSGVAVNALFNSLISAITSLSSNAASSYSSFQTGGFSEVYLQSLYPALLIIPVIAIIFSYRKSLSYLILGREISSGLGMNFRGLSALSVILASALSAISVTIAGMLGFVGLVVPHLAKLLVGEDFQKRLYLSMTMGPALVLLADLLCRTVFSPSELPAGVFTSLIGVPFFIALLLRSHHA